jgi:pyruvate/2-oxoglutarate dehydrogenase complex dihydrolipoamide dehydrogenase (E3) component
MPSKALLHASELFEAASGDEFAHLGIEVKPTLNLAQMMKQKDESVTGLTKGIEYLFRKNKVDWIKAGAAWMASAKSSSRPRTAAKPRCRPRTSSSPPAPSRRRCQA